MSKKLDLSGACKPLPDIFASAQEREEQRKAATAKKIIDIEIDKLDDFPNHPFHVRDDSEMQELIKSIQENGVLTPASVMRGENGRYTLISGHRRKHAALASGLSVLPCEILELTEEEAVIRMVESNFQRTQLLPSEKAWSYRMRLEAMKRKAGRPVKNPAPMDPDFQNAQAEHNSAPMEPDFQNAQAEHNSAPMEPDFRNAQAEHNSAPMEPDFRNAQAEHNSAPMEPDFKGQRSNEQLASEVGESTAQIKRYIRLTELLPALLDLVDRKKFGFRSAVEISYLTKDEQQILLEIMTLEHVSPTLEQALSIKKLSEEGTLSKEAVAAILTATEKKPDPVIQLSRSKLSQYFSKDTPQKEIESTIRKALRLYFDSRK
jgi:ParB family chromosome partitioning protein